MFDTFVFLPNRFHSSSTADSGPGVETLRQNLTGKPDVEWWVADMNTHTLSSAPFLTSKVYLYITTVQSESLACKIGVLHIYNRYTIIYYHNKTRANKKNEGTNLFKYFKFLTIFTTPYKTRTDSHYYFYHHHHRYHRHHHHCQ